jgi:hypothetical protein
MHNVWNAIKNYETRKKTRKMSDNQRKTSQPTAIIRNERHDEINQQIPLCSVCSGR